MTRIRSNTITPQRARSLQNPLHLGVFSQTSLRYLRGTLQATYNVQKPDGFGGGSYNHWFSLAITSPAWIILSKDGERSKYVQLSFYDLNVTPIEGRSIFQADSVEVNSDGVYYPYVGHVMGAQSDLYNTFNPHRLDRGDDRYYPLGAGTYLICVSSTRNEPLNYNVGVVIEFPSEDLFILLESLDAGKLCLEDGIDTNNTAEIGPIFAVNYSLPLGVNAFTSNTAIINGGVTVTIGSGSTWLIGDSAINTNEPTEKFLLDLSPSYNIDSDHEHSLAEWRTAWFREHQETDPFPEVFVPLTTSP